ncbi:FxLYD domain-containing protein [Priestia megaterium]|uniref:FxLYD domain-containing protein n=1 Tax=Priestia megaterium TaxID=1404 RepID=UPI0028132869|nr:FxLYD domain-containing protein [Priestia megaterium]MDR0128705.1 FxLYD domain-containing protein [Priestia megaterium]
MKKMLGVTLLSCGLALAGCSNDTEKETTTKPTTTNEQQGDKKEEVKPENLKIVNKDEVFHTYENDGEKQVNYSAIIQNKSKETVDVSEINITYLNKDGTVIGSTVDSTAFASPSVLKPGQKAYIINQTDLKPTDEVDKVEMTITPEITAERATELPVSGEVLDVNEDNTFMFLRGQVKNTTKTPADDVSVGVAIYDKNDNLITTAYGQVQDTVNPGQKLPFEAQSPFLNFNTVTQPDHYEFFAYSYKYPEGTAGEGGDGEVTE